MSFKMVKIYRKTHEKLDECRKVDNRKSPYHYERSYNDMIGILVDFYLDFNAAGGRVYKDAWRRTKHHRWTEITYPEPEGPTRKEMGCEV